MAIEKNADYMVDNGTDFDKINLSTTAGQVGYTKANGSKTNLQDEIAVLDADMSKRNMQSFTDPTQIGLVKNTCTLVNLYNALPIYGTISYWITSTSSKIQSEIAAQIGVATGSTFGTLSVTKHADGAAIYTFYRYGTTPEFTYIASYDLINNEAHWKNFVKLATATDINGVSDIRIQRGTTGAVAVAGSSSQSVSVTFGVAFSANPTAIAIPRSNDTFEVALTAKSTTGATFKVTNRAANTYTCFLDWIAIGPK